MGTVLSIHLGGGHDPGIDLYTPWEVARGGPQEMAHGRLEGQGQGQGSGGHRREYRADTIADVAVRERAAGIHQGDRNTHSQEVAGYSARHMDNYLASAPYQSCRNGHQHEGVPNGSRLALCAGHRVLQAQKGRAHWRVVFVEESWLRCGVVVAGNPLVDLQEVPP